MVVRKIAAIVMAALFVPALLVGPSVVSASAAASPESVFICTAYGSGTTAKAAEAAALAELESYPYNYFGVTLTTTGSGSSWEGIATAHCSTIIE
jgi:ribosomal protein S12 methylthiotransferase accessory factor YcaO